MSNEPRILTPVFRVLWPALFAPAKDLNGKECYTITMKFDEGEDLSAITNAVNSLIEAKWGKARPAGLRLPLRDQATKIKIDPLTGEEVNAYEWKPGAFVASAKSIYRPHVMASDAKTLISPELGNEREIYPGCYARAMVSVHLTLKPSPCVFLGLRAVQKAYDAAPFKTGEKPEEIFQPFVAAA